MATDPTTRPTAPGVTPPGKPAKRPGGPLARENRRLVAGLVIGAVVALFAVLNLDKVEVNWIVGSGRTPLIIVIGVSFALGVAAGYLGRVARGRRGAAKQRTT